MAMSTRKPFVAGNWKMNLDAAAATALAQALVDRLPATEKLDLFISPPFPYLAQVGKIIAGSSIQLAAQDFYHQPDGAFTGEVSLAMLADCGVSVVLAGHSERRHVIGETDTLINEKVFAALEANMHVVLCVGEKLEQRQLRQTDAINRSQLGYGLAGVSTEQMAHVTVAYEPVWAIGTGKTATPQDAQKAHEAIRAYLRFGVFNEQVANDVRIMYGGSVKSANAADLIAQRDVDGFLVGGASLEADDFLAIVGAAVTS